MAMLGLGLARARARTNLQAIRAAAGPQPTVSAAGWQVRMLAAMDPAMTPVTVSRPGFTAGGAPAAITETLLRTRRVRQVFPNHATLTPDTVALSDYVYATDTIAGMTNGSVEISPKPIAAWVMPSRLLVGNSVDWEMVAFHRDARAGRQVACVRVRGNDGTSVTPWQTVSATAISTLAEDAQPIEVYKGALDITALATGLFWLEAEVFPWIGAAASVLRSNDQGDPREFGKRYFTRNAAIAAAPPLVYVSPTGNDGSGVCSTDPAAAAASPCLTVAGAWNKAKAANGGVMDGVRVRIAGAVGWGTFNGAVLYPQTSAAVVIERAPGTPRASAVLQQSGSLNLRLGYSGSSTSSLAAPLAEGALVLRDVSYQRSAAGQLSPGGAAVGLDIQVWNVAFDNGGISGTWNASVSGGMRFYGMTITNPSTFFGYSPSNVQRLHRGIVTPSAPGIEMWVQIGCRITAMQSGSYRDPTKGLIAYNNHYPSPSSGGACLAIQATNAGETITGIAIVQNLVEVTHAAAAIPALAIGADLANGNLVHVVQQHNTITGYGLAGRRNTYYDEAAGTNRRNHRLIRDTGNIVSQLNTKGDIFVGTNGGAPAEAPFRTGQLAFSHGVGAQGNWSQFATQAPISETQDYPGPGSNIAASATVRNDPLFVNYQGTGGSGGTATVGAGGGDYRLQAGSPARGIVTMPVLAFDLAGAARGGGTQAAGAFL